MGRKRKQEKTEEEIRRKIRKLEDQLAQKRQESVEENLTNLPLDTDYIESIYCESPVPDTIRYEETPVYPGSSRLPSPLPTSPRLASPRLASPGPASPRPASPQPPQTASSLPPQPELEGNELDEETLLLLGDAPKAESPLGAPIHKDVARRWQDILAKGLAKEVKDNLFKEYLTPSNCDLLLAPALNPEVKVALPEALVKRDSSLLYKQKQLGVALSALAAVTDLVLNNETSKQKILKPLSDACRILCDSHYSETRTRRNFVISSINTKLRDALTESRRDKFLFGENVSEKLKAAKTIQQSGDALKNAQKPKFQRTNAPSTSGNNNRGRLNFVPQHRKTNNKPNEGQRAPNYTQRQSTNSNVRRPTDRSLPTPRTSALQRRY